MYIYICAYLRRDYKQQCLLKIWAKFLATDAKIVAKNLSSFTVHRFQYLRKYSAEIYETSSKYELI
jgi:hypothetical protein